MAPHRETAEGEARRAGARAWLGAFLAEPTFLAKYPYYAAVLARVHPVLDPSVSHMAVSLEDGRFFLHVNAEYFARNPQHLTGILLHEVHHVVLGHLSDERFAAADDRELLELALEMSANEYIEEPLPNPIVWKAFERFGVRAAQSTMQRYDALVANRPRGGAGERGEAVDDHALWDPGAPRPGSREQNRALVASAIAEVERERPRDGSGERAPRPRLAGRDPARILEALTGPRAEPEVVVDWRAALEPFIAETRVRVHTYARPSRRFPTRIGEVPGRLFGSRRGLRPHVLVALDTSLSMTEGELREIGAHLAHLAEVARMTIAECDAEVTRVYPFAGLLDRVVGRGGTDLRPPFEPGLLAELEVNGVVYFTDGLGPFPAEPPAIPTLWVLTKPDVFACPWGARVALTRTEEGQRAQARANGKTRSKTDARKRPAPPG